MFRGYAYDKEGGNPACTHGGQITPPASANPSSSSSDPPQVPRNLPSPLNTRIQGIYGNTSTGSPDLALTTSIGPSGAGPSSPATTVAFATATYVSHGLRSASQLATAGTPSLFVGYRAPLPRSSSSPDMTRISRHLDVEEPLFGRSSTASNAARSRKIYTRSRSADEDQISSEYDDEHSQESTNSPSGSHHGPWDEHVKPQGSQFVCTWKLPSGVPCGQLGDKRHLVTRHIKAVHLRIRPFTCRYCTKTFANNSNLEAHENTHTGETPYECPYCKRGFSDRAGLHRHKIKDHNYQPKSKRTQAIFVPPVIHPFS